MTLGVTNSAKHGSSWILLYYCVITGLAECPLAWIKIFGPSSLTLRQDLEDMLESLR